jgi:hypothetical protein
VNRATDRDGPLTMRVRQTGKGRWRASAIGHGSMHLGVVWWRPTCGATAARWCGSDDGRFWCGQVVCG